MHCDVVIVGYRLNAREPAAKAMERILGLDAETARRLARSFPATVRSHMPGDQAERLMADLSAAGALVELHAEQPVAPAKTSVAAIEAAPRTLGNTRRSLPNQSSTTDKISLDLAPTPQPRSKQRSEQHKAAPPPPPAAALYQLGDFGLAGPAAGPRTSAPLQVPLPPSLARAPEGAPRPLARAPDGAPRPSGPGLEGLPDSGLAPRTEAGRRASITGGMRDLDLSAGLPLELDTDDDLLDRRSSRNGSPSVARRSMPSEDLHSLGERFSDAPAAGRAPQVEERAYRSIQRAPRSLDSRRPGQARPATGGQQVLHALRDWAPSTLFLALICLCTLGAVGYALDPADAFGSLSFEQAAAFVKANASARDTHQGDDSNLHPLLRTTPLATRAALASILRARIPGVHEVALHDQPTGHDDRLKCALVENAEGETPSRLAQLRETGREVSIPPAVGAQLREQERALRLESKHAELTFTEICLSL